jgi:Ras family protein T1
LTRIFRICDKDGDNLLQDNELIEIQSEVFKGELTQGDIKGIKDVIKDDVNKAKKNKKN